MQVLCTTLPHINILWQVIDLDQDTVIDRYESRFKGFSQKMASL